MTQDRSQTLQEQLSSLFGSYKAEWLKEQIFELFTEPAYFPELTTARSCILIGGRGTGKTTVLRGLSYQGQFALSQHNVARVSSSPWFGIYHRVNTNHVTAFDGPELPKEQWTALFAHYFNLLLCDMLLEFLEWYELRTGLPAPIGASDCRRIATSLHLPQCDDHRFLREAITDSRISFESYINNVVDAPRPRLSLQSVPVDLLCKAVLSIDNLRGKQFFFLLDEYENLLDYQQQVVNTLIKHSGDTYCFKIGVKELGWRCRSTLNANEQLIHPADYARISISEKLQGSTFDKFALDVCESRLARLDVGAEPFARNLTIALPALAEEEEAIRLGVGDVVQPLRAEFRTDFPVVEQMHALELYFVGFWAATKGLNVSDVLQKMEGNPQRWRTRYGNYKHALLYTIRRKKRGIHKYYCGWSMFTQIAGGNIRYVLELVDQSLLTHLQKTQSISEPVSPEIQTDVAQRVGGMNLSELEGLAVDGAQLTKLLLSLGRIFQVMASDAIGHAPEVNEFRIAPGLDDGLGQLQRQQTADVDKLINSAVMHLALLRFSGNKPGDVGDTKDYDYTIHPIFSALFEFSPRRKRKMLLSAATIQGLVRTPKETIRAVLRANNRRLEADVELPDQLTLFERFYNADG